VDLCSTLSLRKPNVLDALYCLLDPQQNPGEFQAIKQATKKGKQPQVLSQKCDTVWLLLTIVHVNKSYLLTY